MSHNIEAEQAKHIGGFDVYLCRTADAERRYINTIAEMRELIMAALANKQGTLTLELPTMAWMAVLDEIEARRPRNFSQLLRDDTIDRLNDVIERLHEEVTYLVVSGPSPTVAARHNPERQKLQRQVISDELKRSLKDKR
jgi:hypothetical protein